MISISGQKALDVQQVSPNCVCGWAFQKKKALSQKHLIVSPGPFQPVFFLNPAPVFITPAPAQNINYVPRALQTVSITPTPAQSIYNNPRPVQTILFPQHHPKTLIMARGPLQTVILPPALSQNI